MRRNRYGYLDKGLSCLSMSVSPSFVLSVFLPNLTVSLHPPPKKILPGKRRSRPKYRPEPLALVLSKLDKFVKSPKQPFSVIPRPSSAVALLRRMERRESSPFRRFWTPACAGVTTVGTFYEFIKLYPYLKNKASRLLKSPKIYISDSGLACRGDKGNRRLLLFVFPQKKPRAFDQRLWGLRPKQDQKVQYNLHP
jgi:hypothetical protein